MADVVPDVAQRRQAPHFIITAGRLASGGPLKCRNGLASRELRRRGPARQDRVRRRRIESIKLSELSADTSMKLTDFKVLTFDCYGTLIYWESGMIEALKPLTSKASRPL